jgi:hypothetical protein
MQLIVTNRITGQQQEVNYMDPLWDTDRKERVRFVRVADTNNIVVADNDGKELPDWRNPANLLGY